MRTILHSETTTLSKMVTTTTSTPFEVVKAKTLSVQAVVSVVTPAAKTFVDANVNTTTDKITITGHGFITGLKGQLTTTGTLPTGLSTSTDYFVIVVDANTIQLASSLANAQAGTQIDITAAAGGGTHTFTPTSLAGATVTLQKSNDYSPVSGSGTWDAVANATSISGAADIWISDTDPAYAYARLSYTLTAGAITAVNNILAKEDV